VVRGKNRAPKRLRKIILKKVSKSGTERKNTHSFNVTGATTS
jgi:hypothetical protein